MIPDPLHPAVVHFPIVLMVLLPVVALGALWAIRRGSPPLRAWWAPVAVAGALTISAWAALQTGQNEEERAEDIVGEARIESHEEAAERFLILSGAIFGLSAIGLASGTAGRGARFAATLATVGLLVAGYQVGHSGGSLVYGDAAGRGVSQLTAGAAGEAREAGRAGDDD